MEKPICADDIKERLFVATVIFGVLLGVLAFALIAVFLVVSAIWIVPWQVNAVIVPAVVLAFWAIFKALG